MCIYSPMPHTLSYCALIGKCALIRSITVLAITLTLEGKLTSYNAINVVPLTPYVLEKNMP